MLFGLLKAVQHHNNLSRRDDDVYTAVLLLGGCDSSWGFNISLSSVNDLSRVVRPFST